MHSRLALALLLLSVPAASAESPVASAPATAIDNYLTPFVDTTISPASCWSRAAANRCSPMETSALIPLARDRFIDRSYWVPVELRRDASGAITALKYDRFTGEPIKS